MVQDHGRPRIAGVAPRVVERAASIDCLVLDVDGVLTDGRLYFDAGGEAFKAMHVRDGLGLRLLREAGVTLAILSGRPQQLLARRFEELGVAHVLDEVDDKAEGIERLAKTAGVSFRRVAFMGDDLIDLPAMEKVGLSCAPADAAPEVREEAMFVTRAEGGRGAVREVCEFVLKAKDSWSWW